MRGVVSEIESIASLTDTDSESSQTLSTNSSACRGELNWGGSMTALGGGVSFMSSCRAEEASGSWPAMLS